MYAYLSIDVGAKLYHFKYYIDLNGAILSDTICLHVYRDSRDG